MRPGSTRATSSAGRYRAHSAETAVVGSSGPGVAAQPPASTMMASSKSPNPCPPCASGRWMPIQPSTPMAAHTGWSSSTSASSTTRATSGPLWVPRNRWTVRRSSSCSSVKGIGIVRYYSPLPEVASVPVTSMDMAFVGQPSTATWSASSESGVRSAGTDIPSSSSSKLAGAQNTQLPDPMHRSRSTTT